MASARVIEGDCRAVLATLDAGSVQTCVTSPPYLGLRNYGMNGQIGLGGLGEYVEEAGRRIEAVADLHRRGIA